MSDLSARLDLPLIKPSQAQKHVTHNEALQVLDGLVQAALEKTGAETPPLEPAEGQLYALGAGPTGDWADEGGRLALRVAGAWLFITPQDGWRAWDKAAGRFRVFTGGSWAELTMDLDNLEGVGIGTSSDATNRLAVASGASLFSHAGAGHQVKVNKAADTETAALLFQSNWTGHAEMGLAGDTAFSIKVSADGSTWLNAMRADAASGEIAFDMKLAGTAVQQGPNDGTDGRLLTTGAAATVLSGGLESRAACAGTADAITLTTGAGLSAIPVGYMVRFRATAANTGGATINLDGTGEIAARTTTGVDLPAGYIRTDIDTRAFYDGVNWILEREAERGSNANGDYVRFADGTQMCSMTGFQMTFSNASACQGDWTFPAAFSSAPGGLSAMTDMDATLGNVTPALDELLAIGWSGSGADTATARFSVRRIAGASDFVSGDAVTAFVFAQGHWY